MSYEMDVVVAEPLDIQRAFDQITEQSVRPDCAADFRATLSVVRCIGRAEERLALEQSGVLAHAVQVGREAFLVYFDSMQDEDGVAYINRSPRLLAAVGRIASDAPEYREYYCNHVTRELCEAGLASRHAHILPYEENIRGEVQRNDYHDIAGLQLEDGRYAYVDGSWPWADEHSRQQWVLPSGIIIVAADVHRADAIARTLYGGTPETLETY